MIKKDMKDEKIIVRQIDQEDLEAVAALSFKCFGSEMSLSLEHITSIYTIFPKGQACVEYDGKIIGTALSLIVNIDDYARHHTYDDITGGGYIRNHNPQGINLYGIEVGVDPDYRNLNLGKRLYEKRKQICRDFNLRSIIIGGRMPNYHKYAGTLDPEAYVAAVIADEIYDPVITFQKQNGFTLRNILPGYLPGDPESLEFAAALEWINSDYRAT